MKIPYEQSSAIPNITFFGDASSRDREFMVAGGFAVAGTRIQEIEDQIATLRDDFGIKTEFHWNDYRGGKRKAAYESLIRYGFHLIKTRKAALHVMVTPFKKFNHKKKQDQTKDTSINLMYFQLGLHRLCRNYGKSRAIHIRLDAGNDSAEICQLRNQLCAKAYQTYKTRPNCVRSIEPVDSSTVGLVQLSDVVIGAIAANRNRSDYKPDSPKLLLSDFALRASGRANWTHDTPRSGFLTLWNFRI